MSNFRIRLKKIIDSSNMNDEESSPNIINYTTIGGQTPLKPETKNNFLNGFQKTNFNAFNNDRKTNFRYGFNRIPIPNNTRNLYFSNTYIYKPNEKLNLTANNLLRNKFRPLNLEKNVFSSLNNSNNNNKFNSKINNKLLYSENYNLNNKENFINLNEKNNNNINDGNNKNNNFQKQKRIYMNKRRISEGLTQTQISLILGKNDSVYNDFNCLYDAPNYKKTKTTPLNKNEKNSGNDYNNKIRKKIITLQKECTDKSIQSIIINRPVRTLLSPLYQFNCTSINYVSPTLRITSGEKIKNFIKNQNGNNCNNRGTLGLNNKFVYMKKIRDKKDINNKNFIITQKKNNNLTCLYDNCLDGRKGSNEFLLKLKELNNI